VPADPACGKIRLGLRRLYRDGEAFSVVFQNVAEFCNAATRPSTARGGYGIAHDVVESRLRFIERYARVETESLASYQIWKQLVSRYQVSGVAVHAARLVAVMLAEGIRRIFTLNSRDFQRYKPEGIEIVTMDELTLDD
jgi:predicted nucleic acid-binding protein